MVQNSTVNYCEVTLGQLTTAPGVVLTATDLSLEGGSLRVGSLGGFSLEPGVVITGVAQLTGGSLTYNPNAGYGRLECRGTLQVGPGVSIDSTAQLEIYSTNGATIGGVNGAPTLPRLTVRSGTTTLLAPLTVTKQLTLEDSSSRLAGSWVEPSGSVGSPVLIANYGGGLVDAVHMTTGYADLDYATIGSLVVEGGQLSTRYGDSTLTSLTLQGGTLRVTSQGFGDQPGCVVAGVATLAGGTLTYNSSIGGQGRLECRGSLQVGTGVQINSQVYVQTAGNVSIAGIDANPPSLPRLHVASGTCQLGGDLQVSTSLDVATGALLDSGSNRLRLLSPPSSPSIVSGTLRVAAGGAIEVGPTSEIHVFPSGQLMLDGTPTAAAVVREFMSPGHSLTVDGTFAARHFDIGGTSSLGARFSGSIGLPPFNVHDGIFRSGPTGVACTWNVPGDVTLDNIDFENPYGTATYNVSRVASGVLTLRNWGGAFGGPDHEDDSEDQIEWVSSSDADLVPVATSGPRKGVANTTPASPVTWTVRNDGAEPTTGSFKDRIVLSADNVIDDLDTVLALVDGPVAALAAGEEYSRSIPVQLPAGLDGTYYFGLITDAEDSLDEPGAEQNNSTVFAEPIRITSAPRADLQLTTVVTPPTSEEGEPATLSWTVFNDGTGTAQQLGGGQAWVDTAFLSTDRFLSQDDLRIGSFPAPGPLAVDASYLQLVTADLPDGARGLYYLIVRLDELNGIGEGEGEGNNIAASAQAFELQQLDRPDLSLASLVVTPTLDELYIGTPATAKWTIRNEDPDSSGKGTARGAWFDRLYLSTDPVLDPVGDTLLVSASFSGLLAPLAHYERDVPFSLPMTVGTWYLVGELDTAGVLPEANEGNNSFAVPFVVTGPEYTVVLSGSYPDRASPEQVNTVEVPIQGQTISTADGMPVGSVAASIRIRHKGTRRVLPPVVSSATGDFTLDFEPLIGEAGLFEVYADHPAIAEVSGTNVQANFVVHDLRASPSKVTRSVRLGEELVLGFSLTNPGNTPVTGIQATVVGSSLLDLALSAIPQVLQPNQSVAVQATLSAGGLPVDPSIAELIQAQFAAVVEGVSTVLGAYEVNAFVALDAPDIVLVENQLDGARPVIGQAGRLEIRVRNEGGVAATGLQVQVPCVSTCGISPCGGLGVLGCLFQLATSPDLGVLAPGEERSIEVFVAPSSALAIGTSISSANGIRVAWQENPTGLPIPYDLTVDSRETGTANLVVVDELAYWGLDGSQLDPPVPGLAGAHVVLRRYNDSDTLYEGYSDASGQVFDATLAPLGLDILAGTYDVEIDALDHGSYRARIQVLPGSEQNLLAFLSLQAVTYTFTVVETSVPDEYDINIEAEFVAQVPLPKLLVEPSLIHLDLLPGESMQVDLLIQNTGLITANGLELFMPDLNGVMVTPLVTTIGDLPAGQAVLVPVTVSRAYGTYGQLCNSSISWGLRHFIVNAAPTYYWTPIFYSTPTDECGTEVSPGVPPPDLPPDPSDPSGSGGGSSGGGGGGGGGAPPGGSGGGSGGDSGDPVVTPPPAPEVDTGCEPA